MFSRITWIATCVIATLFISWGIWIGGVNQSEILAMKKQIAKEKVAKSETLFSATEQKRKGVVKEIWITQDDGTRLHHRICSERSNLTIVPQGNKVDLIEKLDQISCWMQDKISLSGAGKPPIQQARFLQAAEGFYKYSTQEFLAQTVDMSLYRLQGDTLPSKLSGIQPFLKGIAQDVSFSVSGKNSQFKATQFKAEIATPDEDSK